jgi:hypothetical protein
MNMHQGLRARDEAIKKHCFRCMHGNMPAVYSCQNTACEFVDLHPVEVIQGNLIDGEYKRHWFKEAEDWFLVNVAPRDSFWPSDIRAEMKKIPQLAEGHVNWFGALIRKMTLRYGYRMTNEHRTSHGVRRNGSTERMWEKMRMGLDQELLNHVLLTDALVEDQFGKMVGTQVAVV